MCRSARARATIPAWNRTGSTMSRPGSWKSPSLRAAPRRHQRRLGHAAIAVDAALALTGSLAAGASALTSTAQAPTRAAGATADKQDSGWYGKRDGKCRKGEGHRRSSAGTFSYYGIRRRQSEGQRLRVAAGAQRLVGADRLLEARSVTASLLTGPRRSSPSPGALSPRPAAAARARTPR